MLIDPAEIDAAAAMAEDMGVDATKLPPALQYNLRLATLRRAVFAGTLSNEQARDRAKAFEHDVQAIGTDVTGLPGVVLLLVRLGPISGREAAAAPRIDVTRLGPGSAPGAMGGFAGKVEGTLLRFVRGEPPNVIVLDFVRVDVPGVETFFIATTEVSLGQFIGVAEAAGAWKDLGSLFTSTDPAEDFRKGPRVWRWTDDSKRAPAMRPADKWLRELATGRRTVAETPKTVVVPPPGLAHPMNYVPPAAALLVSHLVGCRLPTLREWQAAAGVSESAKNLRECNLRDAQWKTEQTYISELARAGSVNWPDDDVFLPTGAGAKIRTGPDADSNPWDDGVLWFAPVSPPGGGEAEVRHLVGNVAEYVFDASAGELLAGASAHRCKGRRICSPVVAVHCGSSEGRPCRRWKSHMGRGRRWTWRKRWEGSRMSGSDWRSRRQALDRWWSLWACSWQGS